MKAKSLLLTSVVGAVAVGGGFSEWASEVPGEGRQRHLTLSDVGRPGGTSQVCVRTGLTPQARELLGAGLTTGSLDVRFTSQQVQGGEPLGWEASSSTGPTSLAVTIAPTEPGPVGCSIANPSAPDPTLVLTWPTQPGVDAYAVRRIWKHKPVKLLSGTWTDERGTTVWRIPISQVLIAEDYTEWKRAGGDLGDELRITASADGLPSPERSVIVAPTASGVTCQ